jgi:predicted dehydrogenase
MPIIGASAARLKIAAAARGWYDPASVTPGRWEFRRHQRALRRAGRPWQISREEQAVSSVIRVGVIGAGGYAQGTIRKLLEIPGVQVAALADPAAERRAVTKKNYPAAAGAAEHDDHRAMLKAGGLDAVYISSPHTLHYPQIMDALAAGLHVLVDKPMVCRVQHAKNVVKKARETGLVVLVSYQRHYQGPFIYMRDQVRTGVIGKLQFITAFQSQNWLKGTRGTWRQKMDLSGGGQLNDSGSHLVDILMWIAGEPVAEVSAFSDRLGSEVDINTAIKMRFRGGALGAVSVVGDAPRWHEEMMLVGSVGQILYRNGALTHISGAAGPAMEVTFPDGGANPVANFAQCIRDPKAVNHAPAECGLRTIELTEAAWKSSADGGRVVKVPRAAV